MIVLSIMVGAIAALVLGFGWIDLVCWFVTGASCTGIQWEGEGGARIVVALFLPLLAALLWANR